MNILPGVPRDKNEYDVIKARCRFSGPYKEYVNGLIERLKAYDAGDYLGRIMLYYDELEQVGAMEGIAVKRRMYFLLGKEFEQLGTFEMEGDDPLWRADVLEFATRWYQAADELIGFSSDYALRQAEACRGAAYFRSLSGEDDKASQLNERAGNLLAEVWGRRVSVINREYSGEVEALIKGMLAESGANLITEVVEGDAIARSKVLKGERQKTDKN